MSAPTLTTEQYERLPKWAQRHIDRLTRDLNAARNRITDLTGQREKSPVTVDPYGESYHLPRHTTVQFEVEPGFTVSAYLRRDSDGSTVLDINSSGSKHLAVLPRAANSVYLVGAPR